MPIYEYFCSACGVFEKLQTASSDACDCECGLRASRKISVPCKAKVEHKENLPYGNKSRGKFIPPEGNRSGILIPSWGALEKEEIDYIAEVAIEKEKSRVRISPIKEKMEKVTNVLLSTPRGKRRDKLNEITGGG